jgi:hypothetical protein
MNETPDPVTALDWTPVGTHERVICDSCNRGLREGDEVRVYATGGENGWHLRRVMCPSCGPLAGVRVADAGELHAVATLGYDHTTRYGPMHVLTDARIDPRVQHDGPLPRPEGDR